MDIKVLGPGCNNCVTLARIVGEAVDQLGITASITKVEDYAGIAAFGVMSTPALVIDGRVVISGRVPTPTHVRELLAATNH